jgi:hypothetical protein
MPIANACFKSDGHETPTLQVGQSSGLLSRLYGLLAPGLFLTRQGSLSVKYFTECLKARNME